MRILKGTCFGKPVKCIAVVLVLIKYYFKMNDFNYPSGGERLSSSQRDQLLHEVKQQVALASAQELIQKMSDKCFKKCIYKPGTSLDSSEQKCLAMCMDRYMDTWNTISRTYSNRLQREHGGGSSY